MGARLGWLELGLGVLPFWSGLGLAVWAGGMLWVGLRQGRAWCSQREAWAWIVLAVLFLVSALQAPDRVNALLGLGNFLPFFGFFGAVRTQVTPENRRLWAEIIGGTGLVVAAIGVAQSWGGRATLSLWGLELNWHPRIPGRVDSVFSDANVLASYCLMVLAVQGGLALAAPAGSRGRWGWGMATGITLWALLLTRSLNGLGVVWLLGMGVSLLYRRYLVAGGLLLLGLGILGAAWDWPGWRLVLPELLWGRIPKYLAGQAEDMRTVQWQIAWAWFGQRPGWGWGLRSFPTLYQQSTHSWVGHPHNFWVMLLVETGVWVTGLLTVLVGRVVVQGWWHWRQRGDWLYGGMWLGFVGITCFHGLDVTLFDGRVNGLAWLLLAVLAKRAI